MAVIGLDVFEADVFEDGIFADFTSDFVDRIDMQNKLIFIKKTAVLFHPTDDVYPEVRSIRRIDYSVRGTDIPISSQGNEAAGAGVTPRRAVFNNGWRIAIEYNANTALSITGEMISDDGLAGAQIVQLDYLPDGVSALVNYEPSVVNSLADIQQAISSVPAEVWADAIAVQLVANMSATKTASESADSKIDTIPADVWSHTQ